jgi:Domain of unknown function (DUF4286)
MILYNITSNIHESIEDKWLFWMKETHIPEMLGTGKFTAAKLLKVLVEEEMGGVTYAVQYTANNKADLAQYHIENESVMQQKVVSLFGDKVLSFQTELEVITEMYYNASQQIL